jgi:hypothetical protein
VALRSAVLGSHATHMTHMYSVVSRRVQDDLRRQDDKTWNIFRRGHGGLRQNIGMARIQHTTPLKALLAERGVTETAVARQAGTYPDEVCRQVSGRRPLNARVLEAVSDLTGRALADLPIEGLRLCNPRASEGSRRGWDGRR